MKKIFSIAIVTLFMAVAVFSFQLAYSQSEPDEEYGPSAEIGCACTTSGGYYVYAYLQVCHMGGTQSICTNEDCPEPPGPPLCE